METKIRRDLESRGIDYFAWKDIADKHPVWREKLMSCYARKQYKQKFNEYLHQCGVKLRLNTYCEEILAAYPHLQKERFE